MSPHHSVTTRAVRRIIIDQSKRAKVGHIGSALSVVDLLYALYARVLRISDHDDNERDRFIMSKGHAALALYALLHLKGWLSQDLLDSYCADGSLLGVHPEHELPGIDFSTGSLGQGLSVGVGAALAARLQNSSRRVFVLMSDAECNEGAVWEAAMFASHHRLSNLIALVDANGQQAMGYTRDVLNLSSLADRWRSFGWEVMEVDGHNVEEIASCIAKIDTKKERPHILIAKTTFGRGVSFMHNQIPWHYLPLSDAQYEMALKELETVS